VRQSKATWGLRRNDDIDDTLVVIDHLGGGRRYEVYRAWDRSLFCDVAVKILRPDRLHDERSRSAFAREVEIGRSLAHPNVVRLLRWKSDGARPYHVWEFVSAPSLADHISHVGAVSAPEICLLGIRLCAALHHLHSRGVLHLDVKPSNVTIGDPPRLLDLSLARLAPQPVKLDRAVGTDGYMAPEQCTREALTVAADLFGVGATLYEALTATAPFSEGDPASEEPHARYPQLVEDPLPLGGRAATPALLERVILACLSKEPQSRPRSASEVVIALERVLEELSLDHLLAWPRGLNIRGQREVRSTRTLAAAKGS
jgi:serine/threonine protein kinase